MVGADHRVFFTTTEGRPRRVTRSGELSGTCPAAPSGLLRAARKDAGWWWHGSVSSQLDNPLSPGGAQGGGRRSRQARGWQSSFSVPGLIGAFVISLFLFGGIFSAPVLRAEEGRLLEQVEAQAVLARIKASQAGLATITAHFVEERRIAVLANVLVFSGTVYVEPEDFLFLHYLKPLEHIMKMAGDTVLFFVEGSDTADMVDLAGAEERGQRPDLFSWSPENFQGEVREVADGYLLADPEAGAGNRQVRVVVDRHSLVVRHILLIDQGGDETRISLTDIRLNEKIPDHIRNYALPSGVRVHTLNQQ